MAQAEKRHVWIVEQQDTCAWKWEPTKGIALSRESGRRTLEIWQSYQPCERFRLRKYEAK